jgi:hypothetical protein
VIKSFREKQKTPAFAGFFGGKSRERSGDTTIFSRMLYQLSYLAKVGRKTRENAQTLGGSDGI